MKWTLLGLGFLAIAGSAAAQQANSPPTNSSPTQLPSTSPASPTTPPAASRSAGTAATPATGAAPTATPGAMPSSTMGSSSTANAPAMPNARGSMAAQKKIEADGYKSVQGLTRGTDGRWHGKAMRGNSLVDVTVDARGQVSAQ